MNTSPYPLVKMHQPGPYLTSERQRLSEILATITPAEELAAYEIDFMRKKALLRVPSIPGQTARGDDEAERRMPRCVMKTEASLQVPSAHSPLTYTSQLRCYLRVDYVYSHRTWGENDLGPDAYRPSFYWTERSTEAPWHCGKRRITYYN
jgi:hypothetical protein